MQQLPCDNWRQHLVKQRFGLQLLGRQLFCPFGNFAFEIAGVTLQQIEDVLHDISIASRSASGLHRVDQQFDGRKGGSGCGVLDPTRLHQIHHLEELHIFIAKT